jgi:hypothetical protein
MGKLPVSLWRVQLTHIKRMFAFLAITVVVSFVDDKVRFNCQTATILMRATILEFTTTPAIKFTTCYRNVVLSLCQ